MLPTALEPTGAPVRDVLEAIGPLRLDGAWGRQARDYLTQARQLLAEQHLAGASGVAVVEQWTAVLDGTIRTLYEAARASYAERYSVLDQRCTFIAQGGYGRGELNPCSDIDLLVVYPQRPDAFVETVTEKVLYALWDTGLTVGHALRNLRDCVKLGGTDLKVKTALLDTRYLAGDAPLYDQFVRTMESELLKRNAARFFRDKVAESAERHRKYGDSVFLVEPHLKEGEGGLRDVHTAMWLAKVKYVVRDLHDLVEKGVLTEREHDEIAAARDFLWRVRNALHFLSGQHLDQLTFEYQERIAADLGYRDDGKTRGVEQFMRTYYQHARTLHRFSNDIVSRCLERSSPYRLIGRLGGRAIRPGVRIAGGELVVGDPAVFRDDPSLLLRVFADAQRHGIPLSAATRRLIRAHAGLMDEAARQQPAAARAFLDILGWPHGVYETLHEMHELDVLGAFLPEFGALYCMAQYDRYHIYTVDEHSLRAVYRLEQLLLGEFKQSAPLLTQVMREVDRIELLYVAMLFHDAGKGQGGDHSNRGAGLARAVAGRLGFNADDTEVLDLLVRNHLLMHHLATRRDIHDPKLVAEFARTVGTLATLQKLFVLSFGDLGATNPKLWNSWQDMLLGELYALTVESFERGVSVEQAQVERANRIRARVATAIGAAGGVTVQRFLADLPDRYFLTTPEEDIPQHFELVRRFGEEPLVTAVQHFPEREFSEFTVVTRDEPGLFARLTGVLRANGMNIGAARIATGGSGMVVDVFRVTHLDGALIARDDERWERIQMQVGKVLAGQLDVEQLVAQAGKPSVLGEKVVPRLPSKVEIDNQVSHDFTVIDVFTLDRVGVLFAIANALYHLGLSIHLAKITTSVDRVLDVFYVTDQDGRKIDDPARLALIGDTVREEIAPLVAPPLERAAAG
ncbi:MAG: [protein-PII] uridylyltransferase [Candidatus Binatia bacterium]